MTTESEAVVLLNRIAAGNQAALEGFYRAFEHSIYRYAHLKLNDPHEAADILNEVMLEVWNGAERFEGRSRVSTWVLGIARHKILDRLRARRPDTTDLDSGMDIEDTGAPDPVALSAAAEQAREVRRCLQELSDRQREVVYLTYYQGLSYPEIAVVADCPEGTVKTRMYHARKALQRCLERMQVEPQ
ncbi:MAG: sigma-70 family RNA polymerase sigma factor [Gammaproteobacteria bacterium]|nr:sigma-70 family RNA polymerase sigma factor [Gammaproteobacteria bacterium]